jgi:Putative ABC exporter
MLSASLYIVVCSARNRLRARLRRLREPRYLIGAVVGAAYIYFSFFARFRMSRAGEQRRRARTTPPILMVSAVRGVAPGVVGLVLLALTAAGWLLPFDSGLLAFSEAEIQFLFPAPVSRRGLLIHRLLRSQLGLLFSSLIASVVLPSMSGFSRLRMGIAMWLLLTTAKVYYTGISLARARLVSRDSRVLRVAWLPIVTLTAALVIVGAAVARAFDTAPTGFQDVLIRVGNVTTTGLSSIVLWPFIALARPLFADWGAPYLTALFWSALVLLATLVWVLQIDAAFEDAAVAISQRKAQQPKRDAVRYRVRSGGFPLATHGRPELAFAWKAATQTIRIFGKQSLGPVAAIVVSLTIAGVMMGRASGLAAFLGTFALGACMFMVVLAPQALRVDMREDLRHLEALKTWPVRAASVVRGQLLWPGVLLTALAWGAVVIGEVLAGGSILRGVGVWWRVSGGVAYAILAPAFIFAQLTIHNGVALLFPAWVPLGYQRPRGLDALGQRLIMLFGVWLVLILSAIPGAVVGAIVWFAFSRVFGPAAIIPGAMVFAVVMAIEVLLATEALGPAYEQIDLTAVERAE